MLHGNHDSTHVNLGVACTTGASGQNRKYCTVGGGYGNISSGEYTTVAGKENNASGYCATVGGGLNNAASGNNSTVGGGSANTASLGSATVGGGGANSASGLTSTVAGGYADTASGNDATVGGGDYNTASGQDATVGGGDHNMASGLQSTVAGGYADTASGHAATVPGGHGNAAAGDFSLAAGDSVRISSAADYTFAFGRDFTTSTPNAVIFYNSVTPIKVGIGTTAPDEELHVVGNIKMVDGNQAAGYVLTSDSNGVGTWQTAGGIGGSGTANYVPKFTASTTLGNSAIYETGSRIGIGTTTPNASSKLHVQHDNLYAGYFKSNRLSHSTHVIHSEFTGSGNYDAAAVYGRSTPADNYGIGGQFEGGYKGVYAGVYPTGSTYDYGVHGYANGGSGSNYGVYGYAYGSGTNYGVYGYAGGPGTNYAGYFAGNAMVVGTLSKGGGSFQIDHPLEPENKYLFHSFVESPDMKNVYDGVVTLDGNGEATIQLPTYFEALNEDFRYQLTAIGAPGPNLYIAAKIANNQFTIAGGEPGMEVSWQVTGIRHDKFAEANRIQVEVDKPEDERGKYLHPEAYKLGEEYDIHYEQNKRMKEKEDQRKLD